MKLLTTQKQSQNKPNQSQPALSEVEPILAALLCNKAIKPYLQLAAINDIICRTVADALLNHIAEFLKS